ncbi:MAG: hypothetical protein JXB50_09815 [Spirochaetes bacterium]|nr:hypothetical protein [Spirochaetota bacterium]
MSQPVLGFSFLIDSIEYKSTEHWMMTEKAQLLKGLNLLGFALIKARDEIIKNSI